jgi:hypothetical protein
MAACGGDSTAPKAADITVDSLLADLDAVQTMTASGVALGGVPVSSFAVPSAAVCPYNSSTQRFVCPSRTANGVTMTMYFELRDASGALQSAFSPTTTASIRTVADLSVTPSGAGISGTASLTSHSDQTLSGLPATPTLNGVSTTAFTASVNGVSHTVNMTQTITNLVLPTRGSSTSYPSGTIAMDFTQAGLPAEHVTMTFNGTSVVTMTMTSAGTTLTCTFDLSKPSTPSSCH